MDALRAPFEPFISWANLNYLKHTSDIELNSIYFRRDTMGFAQ